MSYADDLMEQRRDPIGFSLREQKQSLLNQKMVDKTAQLDPEALVRSDLLATYNASVNKPSSSSSLLDFAESSGYRALGNLGDAGRSISNTIFETSYDNSGDTGWSNQQLADQAAGLDPRARQQYDQDVQGVYQDIADGNWLSAAGGSLALGPRALADSAATIPELLAGTALTASGIGSGAGLALLGNKGRKAANTIKAVGKGIDAAKNRSKAFEMTANALRSASNTSILTADMVQQQVNEYKKQNNGESPSGQRIAAMIAGNTAASMLQVSVLKNLFTPFKGKVGNIKPELKKFKEEMSDLIDYAEEGTAKSLVKTVARGIPKVVGAAGAEGAQEYVQTWVEILGTKMKPEEAGGLLEAAYREITDEDNINKSILGAMLGASAGGTAKAALGAPAVAAKATVDVAKGATKTTASVVQDLGSKAAVKALSDKGIEELKTDYEVSKKVAKEATDKLTTKINSISNASTLASLKEDEDIAADIESYQKENNLNDEALADPKAFKDMQNSLVRTYKADRTKIAVGFNTSNLASMAKKAATVNKDRVKKATESIAQYVKSADKETIIGSARDLSSDAIQAVKDIKSSTALGIIEMASNATSEQIKSATAAAVNLELDDLARTYAVVKERNPKMAAGLKSTLDKAKKAKTRAGQFTKETLKSENMPDILGVIVNVGKVSKDQANVALYALSEASKKKIKDSGTLEALEEALYVYKNSDIRQNSEAVKLIEERLKKASKEFKEYKKSTKGKVDEFVKDLDIEGRKKSAKAVIDNIKELRKKFDKKSKSKEETASETSEAEPAEDTVETAVEEQVIENPANDQQELDNKHLLAIYGIADFASKEMAKVDNESDKNAVFNTYIGYLKDNVGETTHSVLDVMDNALGGLTDAQKSIINEYYPATNAKSDETVITDEQFDDVESREMQDQEIKDSYTKLHPGCKI